MRVAWGLRAVVVLVLKRVFVVGGEVVASCGASAQLSSVIQYIQEFASLSVLRLCDSKGPRCVLWVSQQAPP